jgi:ATP-dependent helicase/nuclease subunit A
LTVDEFNEVTLIQTVYAVIDHFELFKQPEGAEYVLKLLDVIQEFLMTKSEDLHEFLTFYEANKGTITISSPEGFNAITITSIHKSKGLEYSVVIVPFANWTHQAKHERIWYNLSDSNISELELNEHKLLYTYGKVAAKEINEVSELKSQSVQERHSIFLDSLNMMYVAFTRAKQRLHILTTLPDEDTPHQTQQMYRDSLAEILVQFAVNTSVKSDVLPTFLEGSYSELTDYYTLSESQQVKYVSKSFETQIDRNVNLQVDLVAAPEFRLQAKSADLYTQSKAKRSQGEYLHHILAQIRGAQYWFDNQTILFQYLDDDIRILVNQVMNDVTLGQLFIDTELLFVERDILSPDGSIFRPDRVIRKDGKSIIVDFKTGKRKEEHQEQIIRYKTLLTQLGQDVGPAVLLYLDDLTTIYV